VQRIAALRHWTLPATGLCSSSVKAGEPGEPPKEEEFRVAEATPAWAGVSAEANPAMAGVSAEALAALKLENADGEAMTMVSHRIVDAERVKIFASAFPQCGEAGAQVIAITAKGPADEMKEFVAVVKAPGSQPELVMGSCQIMFEDMSPSECIEYTFKEEPGHWFLAQVSRDALETYRGMKFEAWKQMIEKPSCEAQFRRMLNLGVVTQLFDPQLFPTPESLQSQYQVTDEKNGKLIQLPHPVGELRVWDAAKQEYSPMDSHLTGAPVEAEKVAWWAEFVNKLRAEHGDEYISGLVATK